MAHFLPLLFTLAAAAGPAAPSPVPGYEGAVCVPGFCPARPTRPVPGGALFLATGLVLGGVRGLRGLRER